MRSIVNADKTKLVIIIILLSAVFITTAVSDCNAGWVDDWLTSHSSVAPNTLQGQKRGYFTFGSFSGRRAMSTDRLFSVSPPKLNMGCGGIDAFLGGFSFLNVDYLVQKFQNILSAAPAAAFDIALNNLCEPCSKTIKSLEAIADQLNNIQMDDCKVSRALTVEVLSPFAPEKLANEKAEADHTFQTLSSSFDLYHAVTKQEEANSDKPVTSNVAQTTTQYCPTDLKKLIQTGSVLANFLPTINSSYSSYINLMRGMVGDVEIVNVSGDIVPAVVAPCGENEQMRVQDFLEGNVYQKSSSGTCTPITDTNKRIFDYVYTKVLSVHNKIKNKQALSADEEQFMATIPAPLLVSLKAAVETGAGSASIIQISDITAREYAYMIVADLYNTLSSAIYKAEEAYSKGGYDRKTCRTEFIEPIVKQLRVFARDVRKYANAIRDDNGRVASTYNAIMNMTTRYEEQNKVFADLIKEYIYKGSGKL